MAGLQQESEREAQRDQITSLQKEIQEMKQYKQLCEARLKDLDPNHPLPVQNEHIGNASPIRTQKQKVGLRVSPRGYKRPASEQTNAIDDQFLILQAKYNELLNNYREMEESFRLETMNNEELQLYIEVLKEAIETRMNEVGVRSRDVDEFVDMTKMKHQQDRMMRDTIKQESMLKDQNTQIARLNALLNEKTQQHIELQAKHNKLAQQFTEATQALQYAENEVQNLEIEKDSLLEFASQQQEKEQNLNQQLEELQQSHSNLNEEQETLQKTNSDQSQQIVILQGEVDKLNQEVKSLSEMRISFVNAENRLKDRREEIEILNRQVLNLQEENSSLRSSSSQMMKDLEEIQQQRDSFNTQNAVLIDETTNQKDQIANLSYNLQQLQKTHADTESALSELQQQFNETDENLQYTQKQLNDLKESYDNLQNQKYQLQNNNDKLNDEAEQYRATIQSLEQEIEDQKYKYTQNNDELLKQQTLNEKMQRELDQLTETHNEVSTEAQRLQSILQSERYQSQRLADENYKLRVRVDELNYSLTNANSSNNDKDLALSQAQRENKSLKEQVDILRETAQTEKAEALRSRQEFLNAQRDLGQIKGTGELAEGMNRCLGVLTHFIRNFGRFYLQSRDFRYLTSEKFREGVYKLNEMGVSGWEDIENWLQLSSDEIESIIRQNNILTNQLQTQAEARASPDVRRYKSQLDFNILENQRLTEERHSLNMQIQQLQADIKQLRSQVVVQQEVVDEEKVDQAIKEKNDYRQLLSKILSVGPAIFKRVLEEILRLMGEVHSGERERMKLISKLKSLPQQAFSGSLWESQESIKTSISNLDFQLAQYQKRLSGLEGELYSSEQENRKVQFLSQRNYSMDFRSSK